MRFASRLSAGRTPFLPVPSSPVCPERSMCRRRAATPGKSSTWDVEGVPRRGPKACCWSGSIQVDPYGSESYGFAVLVGIEPEPRMNGLSPVPMTSNRRPPRSAALTSKYGDPACRDVLGKGAENRRRVMPLPAACHRVNGGACAKGIR